MRKTIQSKQKKSQILIAVLGALILVSLTTIGSLYYGNEASGQATQNTRAAAPQLVVPSEPPSEEQAIINVAKTASPAVVSIVVSAQVPQMGECNFPPNIPPEFRQYFGSQMCDKTATTLQDVAAGSGFLVSSDGYIMTNKHVVSKSGAQYTVILNDAANLGKKVSAKVVSTDPNNDIAVLKIDMNDLPYLSFGDSSRLQVGQTAIAIGYALGQFDNTVSKGVVSGLSRSLEAGNGTESESLSGLIQTDAAINPGNSGGPLLDVYGKVIGMNVAMADSAQSIGFAIPGNAVKLDYDQAHSTGKITGAISAFLGVRYTPITTALQSNKNLPYNYGMYVTGDTSTPAVVTGSPAEKAGLQSGDIILEIDGRQLNEVYTLASAISQRKPGDVITLKIYHDGSEKNVKATLGQKQ